MFANVRLICREYRIAPSCAENAAGRLHRPPKSPSKVTPAQRCLIGTWRVGEGRKVRRDDSYLEVIVDGQRKTPQPGQAWGVGQKTTGDSAGDFRRTASKLIAEANAIAASIPSLTGEQARRAAASQFLKLWRQVLHPGQQRPGSWRVAAAPGGLGRYEARKLDLQSSDRSASRYSRGCRLMARQAGV